MIKRLAAALLLLVFAAGCGQNSDVVVLRMAHILDPAQPVHKAMVFMGERLSALSGGTMEMKIYYGGTLGNERESLELLQLGMLDMAKVNGSIVEAFVPAMGVYGLPYLFRDSAHQWAVFNGPIGKEILEQGEPYWIRGLVYYDSGFRSFYTTKAPIRRPEDLKGMKIRVIRSNVAMRTMEALGGSPTPMALGELYTALQQGVVDGAENNPPSYYYTKHFEAAPYYSLDEHSAPPDVVLVSTHTWNRLTPQQRQWLTQAAEESVVYQRKLWQEDERRILLELEAGGVTIVRPDKEPFRKIVEPIYKGLEGTELGRWADRIRAVETPADSALASSQTP